MAGRDDGEREGRGGRWLLFVAALLVGLPLLALSGLAVVGPPTGETWVFVLAVLVGVIGGLAAPWQRTAAWGARGAFVVVLLLVGYRILFAASGTTVRAFMAPGGGEVRWTDRVVPERDLALGASRLLIATGRMDVAGEGLIPALRDGYSRMRRHEGPVPSAVLSTYLFGQSPDEHTVLRVAPASRFNPPEAVVIFLHGLAGNITIACWQVAQAANPVGLDVICPSTGWRAEWAGPEGRAIVEATIARVRAQGARRVYLAGLSAGAIGASRLAHDVDIDGLILLSGASARPRPGRVPTLVLHGRRDRPTLAAARSYARTVGRRATYEEHPDANHWLLLSHHEWVTGHLRDWLAERENAPRVRSD